MRTYETPDAAIYSLYADIAAETNVLISGWVGSGKSELIHSLIYTIICEHTPASAVFWFCDPKKVELERWRFLPHAEMYADTAQGIVLLLSDLQAEMESRYSQMKKAGVRLWQGKQIYLVLDELADLMTGPVRAEVGRRLIQIMQLSRAAGIHVIAGTQKASRLVIPARMECNFTCRVALMCFSAIESRQTIGISGAEKLTGPGVGYVNRHGKVLLYSLPMTAESEKGRVLAFYQNQSISYNHKRQSLKKWQIFKRKRSA